MLEKLTIFGAGLIGGSVALAARRAGLARRIVAIDRRAQPARHPFDEWFSASDDAAVTAGLAGASLVVLATPVQSIMAELPRALGSGGVVTDCGSTKRAVVNAARGLPGQERFVPSHPMAGRPVGGLEQASAELFDGRSWLLCPAGAAPEAVELLREFVTGLGARAAELSPEDHDHSVAITSHLPQLLASALAVLADREQALRAAGPGFASATRVAGGAESMWRDIFETNGDEIGRALRLLAQQLDSAGASLEQRDTAAALALLEQARRLKGSAES